VDENTATKWAIAALGTAATYLWGGWDAVLVRPSSVAYFSNIFLSDEGTEIGAGDPSGMAVSYFVFDKG